MMKSRDFERLYSLYYASVRDFIKKYVYSATLAEDLTQEVFIKVWDQRDRLEDVTYLKTYLFSMARNHTFTALKTISRSKESLNNMVCEIPVLQTFADDDMQVKEYMDFITQVLERIPARSRTIFKLCREEGKSYAEVAENLGISKNAIKNHMVGTMKILKNAVEDRFGIPLSVFLYILLK
ncbi:RNA polymerase sigma-70 factor [Pedobacter sp. HMWF019]|uniref:RNA polymerase sigma factor n=1 Tax=Pedobacter sp. HMWF019 TaxID=2056856 RepID=UPI000D370C62|nr:RNA polymerase sigma-70 factor [Pedobacter sp. HMWF019]PTT01550.1 RNA polymerase sigma-70 factor [Pedobacter sp. HMWF019]